jgi:hypothetical protein
MSDAGRSTYEATFRRSEIAIPALLAVVALFGVACYAAIRFVDGRHLETAVFTVLGGFVLAMAVLLLQTFRTHRWIVGADGVRIHEGPRVAYTGLSRRAHLALAQVAALRRVESGFDRQIELVARDGRRFRLSQKMTARDGAKLPAPDPDADLDAFAESIRAAIARAGLPSPAIGEGLSFWNSVPGLALIAVLLLFSLAISGVVVWALLDGMTTTPRPRGGEAMAILILLPVGAGWLFWKCWKRRRKVLATLQETAR